MIVQMVTMSDEWDILFDIFMMPMMTVSLQKKIVMISIQMWQMTVMEMVLSEIWIVTMKMHLLVVIATEMDW